jgi:rhodanese-related sulfurtransferase
VRPQDRRLGVEAAAFLRREGYPDVSDLLGGYQAWTALAQPVA